MNDHLETLGVSDPVVREVLEAAIVLFVGFLCLPLLVIGALIPPSRGDLRAAERARRHYRR